MNFNSFFKQRVTIIIGLAYALPIVLNGIDYIDDMGRAISGYGWSDDGRFVSTLLMQILSFSDKVLPLFPYATILSVIITCFSGFIISELFFKHSKYKFIFSLVLLTSPFFLENLSYKYDSLPMSLSVLMAIVPFTLYRNHIFIPISILCLVAVLGLYQTTSMLYFAVTICIIMSSVLDGKNKTECFKFACKTLVSFIVAFLIYKSLVLLLALNVPRSQFISINSEILNLLIERMKHFHIMLKALFDSGYFIASAPFVILFAMSLVYLLALRKSLTIFFIIVLCFMSLLILTMMPNILLKEIFYTARTMICFPAIIIAMLIVMDRCKIENVNKLCFIFVILLVSYSFSLSAKLGAVIKNNNEASNYFAGRITSDISTIDSSDTYKIVISGRVPISAKSKLLYNETPFLNWLAPVYASGGWGWGVVDLSRYADFKWQENETFILQNKCHIAPLFSNKFYAIRKKDNVYIIDFNYKDCI